MIAGTRPGRRVPRLHKYWERLRTQADLEDVRIHDLRHSLRQPRSGAAGKPHHDWPSAGHTKVSTTARYAHLARDTEKASAAKVGGSIAAHLLTHDAGAA